MTGNLISSPPARGRATQRHPQDGSGKISDTSRLLLLGKEDHMATATMMYPIPELMMVQSAQYKVTQVNSRLKSRQAQRVTFRQIFSIAYSTISLTFQLATLVRDLSTTVRKISDASLPDRMNSAQLLAASVSVRKTVAKVDGMISRIRDINFPGWRSILRDLDRECDRLDAIAETFSMIGDDRTQEQLRDLAALAESERTVANDFDCDWRKFVAALQD